VPITATIDGEPDRGTLVRMGMPDHCLGVLEAIQKVPGVGARETPKASIFPLLGPVRALGRHHDGGRKRRLCLDRGRSAM
jgi:hypothetical protein